MTTPAKVKSLVAARAAPAPVPPAPKPIPPTAGDIVRKSANRVLFPLADSPGLGDPNNHPWTTILHADVQPYVWGQLLISVEHIGVVLDWNTEDGGTTEGTYNFISANFPHMEVRVLAWVGGIPVVWFEGALGSYADGSGSEKSSGPISLPFAVGEVPDVIEVLARLRAGNPAILNGFATTGALGITALTRFRT